MAQDRRRKDVLDCETCGLRHVRKRLIALLSQD